MSGAAEILDNQTRGLVSLAAAIALGEGPELRERIADAIELAVPPLWVDELLLQSQLMVGWPRTLVAAGLWRAAIGKPAEPSSENPEYTQDHEWARRGEAMCRLVYGEGYDKLRHNVQKLHPALDTWMITEGYGRTLAREGLDAKRREFCVVAQTAVLNTPRQLHSHLVGALRVGATPDEVEAALRLVNPFVSYDDWKAIKDLWEPIRDSWVPLL